MTSCALCGRVSLQTAHSRASSTGSRNASAASCRSYNPRPMVPGDAPLRIGPLDLSPIVAIIVLQVVGGIVIDIVDPA